MDSIAYKLIKTRNFKNLFSISVGKVYSDNIELKNYIGNYSRWSTDVTNGILKIDEKEFKVQYLGTVSTSDNMWFTAEMEQQIPDQYVDYAIKSREMFTQLELNEFCEGKIALTEEITGDKLATIYCAFMPISGPCTYLKMQSNDLIFYMCLENIPQNLFEKIGSSKFVPRIMEIINNNKNIDHKLMIQSFLLNNKCQLIDNDNSIVAIFDENSKIVFNFDENNRLISTEGALN